MGYTHHWETIENAFMPHLWLAAIADCEQVAYRIMADGIELGGPSGESGDRAYEFNGVRVAFNGFGDGAYESFVVPRCPERRYGRKFAYGFCKTAHKPYDLAVTACLLVLKHHLGATFRVGSDGVDADWSAAKALVQDELGYGAGYTIQDNGDGEGRALVRVEQEVV